MPHIDPVPSQLEAIESPIFGGLIAWIIVSGVCFGHLARLYIIDKLHRTKHARLCRSSKTVAALRLVAALAVLTVYVAGGNHQGFVCHEHDDGPTCAQDGGSWVFPYRFVGYAVAAAAINYTVGLLIWADTNSRYWLSIFGAALWLVSGVFGTYTGYDNHHWWYFYLGLFSFATLIVLFACTRRRRGLNVTIILDVYVLLHIAALVIWIFSPAGYRDEYLDIEIAHWFYLVFDFIVYAAIPLFISLIHIPHRFAVAINGDRAVAYKKSANLAHVTMLENEHAKCVRDIEYAEQKLGKPSPQNGTLSYGENWLEN